MRWILAVDGKKKNEKRVNVSSERPYVRSTARSTNSELRSVILDGMLFLWINCALFVNERFPPLLFPFLSHHNLKSLPSMRLTKMTFRLSRILCHTYGSKQCEPPGVCTVTTNTSTAMRQADVAFRGIR